MSDVIKLLPDHVANQIAAGEVVQRPASVVKELLENSIDAGATQIQLVVRDAGKTLVQVIDNGNGMSSTDLRMSFERHATSKISSADDLFNLHTKGFRGEALASVAAVAQVSVKSKREEDDLGSELEIEGSKVLRQEPVVTSKGTMVSVRNLFYNIPARRKFLKSDQVELRNITDEFHRVAMVHPDVSMSFTHNDTPLFTLQPGNHRQRIVAIMGAKTNEKLVPVEEETELMNIKGFIGKPEFARKTRGLQYFFVNGRFIKHNYLHHAVSSAFEGLLKDKANPSYFLYFEVPPDTVDINIHPTKTEVKFDDEHSLYAILRATVKHALGQFSVNSIDFNQEQQYDVPYDLAKRGIAAVPKIEVDPDFNPFQETSPKPGSGSRAKNFSSTNPQPWEALYTDLEPDTSRLTDETDRDGRTGELFDQQEGEQRHIFQLQRKFIISALQSGLLVINQQRAHERILYEKLLRQLTVQNGVSQQLLFPIKLNLPQEEVEILKHLQADLEHTGFLFKSLEHNVVEMEGLPLELKEKDVPQVIDAIVSNEQQQLPEQRYSSVDSLAQSIASGMSIKTGEQLSGEAMHHMVDELFACKEPTLTAAGKKIFIKLSGDQLNSKFD
ncbi:DNA mismatch repair endonuclease MutL [Nonlabens xiamenensis]|uniref:DNA mismatch repair endonuclease MutL n=1 Tax=Nonlabens xiamenensis TaxID=2341043 RepID=UPI000F60E4C1|nr:DNA mismatch repair endonuclease MutL [Nonlabens xiamenensis]